jgi:gliding motility-associated lipoprotein GldH
MFKQWIGAVAAVLLISGCLADKNTVIDEFKAVNIEKWNWHQGYRFSFEITEPDYLYDFYCGLRVTGKYQYSNIWLIYTLNGPDQAVKKLFQIQLADNTGKWQGKGLNNLISFEQSFIKGVKLKPGKYTLFFQQNMREEELKAVSDIGLKVIRTTKVY